MKNKALRNTFYAMTIGLFILDLFCAYFPERFVDTGYFKLMITLMAVSGIAYILVCRAHFKTNYADL